MEIWKPLDLRIASDQPLPGQLIAVRQTIGGVRKYDMGRVKVIDGRRSYYSVKKLGALMLSDESDTRGFEWMPMMERDFAES